VARDVVEQVRALCALATSPTTPLEEARNAALQAVRRIHELDLLGHVRKADAERAKKATPLDRVRVKAHFLILGESEKHFRFCQLTAESRWKGATKTFTWPKGVVHAYTLLGDEEKHRLFGFAGRVTDTLVLDRAFVEGLEKHGSVHRF